MTEYEKCPDEVLALAQEVIELYHPELTHGACAIGFIMRSGPPAKSGGREVWGKCKKVGDELQPYIPDELDFVIILSEDAWAELGEDQKRALLDHELCHIQLDDKGNWKMRGHDFEEFVEVVHRWGAWRIDLMEAKSAFDTAEQGILPGLLEEKHKKQGRLVVLEAYSERE